MKTIQSVVLVVALSLFLGSRADAAMLKLDFTVALNEPADANFEYVFFEGNARPRPDGVTYGFSGQETVLTHQTVLGMTPGTRRFSMTVDVENLSNFHFAMWGSAMSDPWSISLFAASPMGGYDGAAAWFEGPPWVSLATIIGTKTLGNTLTIFDGPFNPLTGLDVGSWELTATPVPEPTTLVLLGTGVGMVLRRRHLAKKKAGARS